MKNILCLNSGILYSNPIPHVISRHAYFPSVVLLENGEMLASFAIGEAFEAVNLNTHIARSTDGGESWSEPVSLLPSSLTHESSNCARLTALPGGEVVALVVRHCRSGHLQEGLANPTTLGFVPIEILLVRSYDYGRTWAAPQIIEPPLEGPSFELCSPIMPLSDGRWIWPTSTWRGWDGHEPNGMKMLAFVSHDRGATWPEYSDVMADTRGETIYWESKIIELSNGSLLAVAWAYDEQNACDSTNHFSLSQDGGRGWLRPADTGLHGQTMAILELPGGDILSVYRRTDTPGLWANLSSIENGRWLNHSEAPLWCSSNTGQLNRFGDDKAGQFKELKFGAPCIVPLPDGTFYVAFWCYENLVSVIRWFKLAVI